MKKLMNVRPKYSENGDRIGTGNRVPTSADTMLLSEIKDCIDFLAAAGADKRALIMALPENIRLDYTHSNWVYENPIKKTLTI